MKTANVLTPTLDFARGFLRKYGLRDPILTNKFFLLV